MPDLKYENVTPAPWIAIYQEGENPIGYVDIWSADRGVMVAACVSLADAQFIIDARGVKK